jgi:hypothetical protein
MSQPSQETQTSPHLLKLSRSFSWLGWTGFWLQVVLGSLPIITLAYLLAFTGSADSSRSFPFIEYLAILNVLTTLFTIYWSFHYTRLARRIRVPERCPSPATISRTVWTGVIASTIGIFFSTVVILIESATLLMYFLKAPQAGLPVLQTSGTEAVRLVTTMDMVGLVALILTLFAEVIVLMFNLRLLYRTTPRSSESARPAEVETSSAGDQGERKPVPETASHPSTGTPS